MSGFSGPRPRSRLSWFKGGFVVTCRIWAGALALVFAAAPAFAQAPQNAAGRIKVASGSVFIVRAGALVPAQAGQEVFEADSLKTGADGRLGITLKDDTRVSLGPSSEVRVDRFVFAPAEGRMGLVLKVVRGVIGVCVRTDCQALARLHSTRDAGGGGGRPWHHPGASRRTKNDRRATLRCSDRDRRGGTGVGLRPAPRPDRRRVPARTWSSCSLIRPTARSAARSSRLLRDRPSSPPHASRPSSPRTRRRRRSSS